jgi:predicted metal-binding protein
LSGKLNVMAVSKSLEELCEIAIRLGAAEAKVIKAGDVVVRDWVRLKCQYGCDGYGKRLTCPPYSPTPEQMRRVLSGYNSAILLRFEPGWEKVHRVVASLEREAFLSGYYSAFGLTSGPCPLCKECNLKNCVHPELARPSMEACGIDVYATARGAGFKIDVVKTRREKPRYFGLLLVT